MSTAEAFDAPGTEPLVDADSFPANLREILKVLLASRHLSHPKLAAQIKMSRSTYYRNLETGGFTVPDLLRMSDKLDVPYSTFFTPVDELLAGFRTGSFATSLEIVPPVALPNQGSFDDTGWESHERKPDLTSV